MEDTIIVSQLDVLAHVGVLPAERGAAQRLTVSLRLIPVRGIGSLGDDVANAVDYAAVCAAVRQEVQSRARRLIETLAEEVASLLLSRFPLRAVEVEVRKFILQGAEYVAVAIRRERTAAP